jgi:hypothetical protein
MTGWGLFTRLSEVASVDRTVEIQGYGGPRSRNIFGPDLETKVGWIKRSESTVEYKKSDINQEITALRA